MKELDYRATYLANSCQGMVAGVLLCNILNIGDSL